ncbi:MAG: hypothetical protein QXP01_00720 [Candidatus Hadarchaeum sp.]
MSKISKEEKLLVWMLARASFLRVIAQIALDVAEKIHAHDEQYKLSHEYLNRNERITDYDWQIKVALEELENLNPKLKSKVLKELMHDITVFRKYIFSNLLRNPFMCKIAVRGYFFKWQSYQGDAAPSPFSFTKAVSFGGRHRKL